MKTLARTAPALPAPVQLSLADELATFELNRLPAEVARYLAAVDEYRRLGARITWRIETDGR